MDPVLIWSPPRTNQSIWPFLLFTLYCFYVHLQTTLHCNEMLLHCDDCHIALCPIMVVTLYSWWGYSVQKCILSPQLTRRCLQPCVTPPPSALHSISAHHSIYSWQTCNLLHYIVRLHIALYCTTLHYIVLNLTALCLIDCYSESVLLTHSVSFECIALLWYVIGWICSSADFEEMHFDEQCSPGWFSWVGYVCMHLTLKCIVTNATFTVM